MLNVKLSILLFGGKTYIASYEGIATLLIVLILFNIAFDIRQKRIIMYRSMQDLEQQLLNQVSRLKVNGE